MAYDDRFGERDSWRSRDSERDRTSGQGRNYDRGYGRDRYDRDPGAHTDYYRGGDRGQRRSGPEGGFESRGDYRRSDRFADQGQSYGGTGGRDEGGRFPDRHFGGSGGINDGDMAFGGPRDTGFGFGPGIDIGDNSDRSMAGGGFSSSARSQAILDQAQGDQYRFGHDPDYSNWRRRQIDAFDRDYDEYRRENAARFENEFGSWRQRRGEQRTSMGRVSEHMEVVGSDGSHVGTVDKVRDGRIVLTKSDPSAGGHHHSIPCGWLESVDDKVTLNKTADEAMKAWRDEETSRAMFEPRGSGSDGPHILERSFSGTYRGER